MLKKTGWLWIISSIILFFVNFFTLGNSVITKASWANVLSGVIGYAVCPILFLIGIFVLIMGKK
jgi:hypothetical protein